MQAQRHILTALEASQRRVKQYIDVATFVRTTLNRSFRVGPFHLHICDVGPQDAEIPNIHDELQTRRDHTRQSLKKALSRDGILRLRAVSDDMYRALKTVDVDLALELCCEALLWGELCRSTYSL